MAELIIGKHCNVMTCNSLDFLPCSCNGCGLDYCKDHMSYDSHNCIRNDLEYRDSSGGGGGGIKSHACAVKNCDRRELVPMACDACGENVCLLHRHQSDHACKFLRQPVDRMTRTAEHVRQIVSKADDAGEKKRVPTSQKSRATAAKIALMKVKQKAVGDKNIPDADRVYFRITLPLGSKDRSVEMYFNRTWSVGRAIDKAASAANVINANNNPNAKRLSLFDSENGFVLPNEQLLENVLLDGQETGVIYNGCALIMERTDRDVEKLPSLEPYKP